MRSSALVASSLATVSRVAADPTNYNDCVATCKPILDVSSQCGLPVPANPQNALDPATWTTSAWTNPSFWANGVVPFGGPNSVGWSSAGNPPWASWGGYGGAGGYGSAGGWGGYGAGGGAGWGAPAGGAGWGAGWGTPSAGGAGWSGATWNLAAWLPTQTNCVCTTKAFSLQTVGGDCMTCLSKTNALANPYLNSLATTCNFANGLIPAGGTYVGTNPVPAVPVPAPAPAAPLQPVGSVPLAPKPGAGPVQVNRREAHDGDEEPEPSTEVQQKWGSGGGYGGNSGSWGSNGAPVSGPPPSGPPVIVNGQQQPQQQNGGQPVFWSGAEKSLSVKGLVGLALAGIAAVTVVFL